MYCKCLGKKEENEENKGRRKPDEQELNICFIWKKIYLVNVKKNFKNYIVNQSSYQLLCPINSATLSRVVKLLWAKSEIFYARFLTLKVAHCLQQGVFHSKKMSQRKMNSC